MRVWFVFILFFYFIGQPLSAASWSRCSSVLAKMKSLTSVSRFEEINLDEFECQVNRLLEELRTAKGTHWPRLLQVEDEVLISFGTLKKFEGLSERVRTILEKLHSVLKKIGDLRESSLETAKTELSDGHVERVRSGTLFVLQNALFHWQTTEAAREIYFGLLRDSDDLHLQFILLSHFESFYVFFVHAERLQNEKLKKTASLFIESRKIFLRAIRAWLVRQHQQDVIDLEVHPQFARRFEALEEKLNEPPTVSLEDAKTFFDALSGAESLRRPSFASTSIKAVLERYADGPKLKQRLGELHFVPNVGRLIKGDLISPDEEVRYRQLADFLLQKTQIIARRRLNGGDLDKEVRRSRALLQLYEILKREGRHRE